MSGALQIAQPAVEPVTVAEAKEQLRITHSAEDLIARRIKVAREAEERLERTLITTTWRLTMDAFLSGGRLSFGTEKSFTEGRYSETNNLNYYKILVGYGGWSGGKYYGNVMC